MRISDWSSDVCSSDLGLMAAIARAPDPAAALNRLDTMICRLPSAINFFKLLEARPGLTAMLSEILSHAPVLAEALAQRTELLDGLIDATAFDPQPDVPELVRLFSVLEPGEIGRANVRTPVTTAH